MAEHTSDHLRQSCQRVAQALIARYGWGLLKAEELAELIVSSADWEIVPAKLEERAIRCYAAVLFEACHQDEEDRRQALAYMEVHRFLFRAAYNRWPGLPQDTIEEVAQQALVLVYEQIDRCSSPETFLSFAFWKLRQAGKNVLRGKSARDVLGEDVLANMPDNTELTDVQYQAQQQERINALLDAINRLPDDRLRRVILLKFQGRSDIEIGEQLSITANYVRVLRNHAKQLLKQDKTLRRQIEAGRDKDV